MHRGQAGDRAQGTAATPTGCWRTDAPSAGAVANAPKALGISHVPFSHPHGSSRWQMLRLVQCHLSRTTCSWDEPSSLLRGGGQPEDGSLQEQGDHGEDGVSTAALCSQAVPGSQGCWGPRTAPRGAPAPPACPPEGGRVAMDNATLTATCSSPSAAPGARGTQSPAGPWRACQGRDTDPPLCLQSQS